MVAPLAITVAIGAASLLLSTLFGGVHDFAPGACDRLEPYLLSEVVGQELAVEQVCYAVCDHLATEDPEKPLVLSLHGPPGVGKTMLHHLLARALYNKRPSADVDCPGPACLGYKVIYGMDHVASERVQQHERLRDAIKEHLRLHPQSLLVIEEYDKLDCPSRGLLRQLIDMSSWSTNVTINKSIIMLESNEGFPQIHEMLVQATSRSKISGVATQRMLKDLIFSLWSAKACESSTDTVKLLSLFDFYLPFLPLERTHIQQLFTRRLEERQAEVLRMTGDTMMWTDDVIDFLTAKVDFDGSYPIEGAKEVRMLMTRYVTRALRVWERGRKQLQDRRRAEHKASGSKKRLQTLQPCTLSLSVSRDGEGLEIVF